MANVIDLGSALAGLAENLTVAVKDIDHAITILSVDRTAMLKTLEEQYNENVKAVNTHFSVVLEQLNKQKTVVENALGANSF